MDFDYIERPSDSPLVERIWYSYSEKAVNFTSIANSHWGIVATKREGKTILTIRGPETVASPAIGHDDAEFIGIQFKAAAFMPNFSPSKVMDRQDLHLPEASNNSFWLSGATWEVPDFENAEEFVKKLVREGLLVYDPLVERVLEGQPVNMSLRTIQRRFLQATGLSLTTMYQIKRARYATLLLKEGVSILDTIEQAGYFDQAHLTKSLKRLVGQTPAQLLSQHRATTLSLLYKTEPF